VTRSPVGRLGLLATVVAVGSIAAFPGSLMLAVEVYSAFLATLAVAAVGGVVASLFPLVRLRGSRGGARARQDPVRAELERLPRQIELTLATSGEPYTYVRPVLREIASRLLLVRGVELDRQPGRAERVLGREVWELVRPDRPRLERTPGGGVSLTELEAVVSRLEAL
jgi:hypothetical protein